MILVVKATSSWVTCVSSCPSTQSTMPDISPNSCGNRGVYSARRWASPDAVSHLQIPTSIGNKDTQTAIFLATEVGAKVRASGWPRGDPTHSKSPTFLANSFFRNPSKRMRKRKLTQHGGYARHSAFKTMVNMIQSISCQRRINIQFTPAAGNLLRLAGVSLSLLDSRRPRIRGVPWKRCAKPIGILCMPTCDEEFPTSTRRRT